MSLRVHRLNGVTNQLEHSDKPCRGGSNRGESAMTDSVTILGTAATPVGKWQTAPGVVPQVLEHEVLAKLVVEAVADQCEDGG